MKYKGRSRDVRAKRWIETRSLKKAEERLKEILLDLVGVERMSSIYPRMEQRIRAGGHIQDSAVFLHIENASGVLEVSPGDWLVMERGGLFYPMPDLAFRLNFEPVLTDWERISGELQARRFLHDIEELKRLYQQLPSTPEWRPSLPDSEEE